MTGTAWPRLDVLGARPTARSSSTSSSTSGVVVDRLGRQLRHREAERPLRQQRDARAERHHAEADPDPVHERVDDDVQARRLVLQVERRHHDVEVLRRRRAGSRPRSSAPPRACGRTTSPGTSCRSPCRPSKHGQVPRDHLLLAVVGDLHRRRGARVKWPDLRLLPGLQQHLLFLLEALAREAEEHQHDAEVDDVAAVAALASGRRGRSAP